MATTTQGLRVGSRGPESPGGWQGGEGSTRCPAWTLGGRKGGPAGKEEHGLVGPGVWETTGGEGTVAAHIARHLWEHVWPGRWGKSQAGPHTQAP